MSIQLTFSQNCTVQIPKSGGGDSTCESRINALPYPLGSYLVGAVAVRGCAQPRSYAQRMRARMCRFELTFSQPRDATAAPVCVSSGSGWSVRARVCRFK